MIRVKIPTLFIEMMNNALLLLHSEEQKSTAIFCSFLLMNNRVHEYLFQNGEKHEFPISKDLINQMRTFSIVNRKKKENSSIQQSMIYLSVGDINHKRGKNLRIVIYREQTSCLTLQKIFSMVDRKKLIFDRRCE